MATKRKKLPKELCKPKVASVVLEISAKDGFPMSETDRLKIRRVMRQFARGNAR
jgi:hypothetical protein